MSPWYCSPTCDFCHGCIIHTHSIYVDAVPCVLEGISLLHPEQIPPHHFKSSIPFNEASSPADIRGKIKYSHSKTMDFCIWLHWVLFFFFFFLFLRVTELIQMIWQQCTSHRRHGWANILSGLEFRTQRNSHLATKREKEKSHLPHRDKKGMIFNDTYSF